MTTATEILQRILTTLPPATEGGPACPALAPGEHCDQRAHYLGDPTERPRPAIARWCPEAERVRTAERITAEEARLGGLLGRCGGGLAAYDPSRAQNGTLALTAVRDFAAGRPPARNVLLAGPLGTGKTHLLLSAHFDLLRGGMRSHFVSSTDLRELFGGCGAMNEARREEAAAERVALESAQTILWDDAGDVEGDERRRGAFAEGLKHLLDRSRAAWAVSTNLTYEEARRHPDVGAKVISRLLDQGTVVRLSGADQRLRRGRG